MPMALCVDCHEPLVMTKEWSGFDFVCVVCGRKHTFMEPTPGVTTEALRGRQSMLRIRYDLEAGRRARGEI